MAADCRSAHLAAGPKSWTSFRLMAPVYQAGTLSGNPLAMAAGLAQLRELERINGWKLLEEIGAQLERLMRSAINDSEDRSHISSDRFDVLLVLRPGTDSRPRERAAERFKNIREILSRLPKARHLFRAIAV